MLLLVDRHNFDQEVLESSKLVFVNFWADWSEECKQMKVSMKKLDRQLSEHFKIVEINWERDNQLAQHYNVVGTPTLLVFDAGNVVERYFGTFNVTEFLQDVRSKTVLLS